MNTNRVEQIKESLSGLGTDPEQGYTHKEIISRLIELENALLAGVYEKNHAENMRPQDLTKHFAALAEEFGLDSSDIYQRFLKNMDELDHTVKSLIAGQKGEQLAKCSLRPLTYDRGVKILYNIALENRKKHTYDCTTMDEIKAALEKSGDGFVRAMWCGEEECEDTVKAETGVGSRCIPFEQETLSDKCVCCGKPAKKLVYWGKAY